MSAVAEQVLPKQVQEQIRVADERTKLKPLHQQPEPPPSEPAAAAPTAPATPPREETPGYWKARYQVSEGLLKQESSKHKETKATLRQLEEANADLRKRIADMDRAALLEKMNPAEYLDERTVGELGEESARELLRGAVKLQEKLNPQPSPPVATVPVDEPEADGQAEHIAVLSVLVPDWPEINQDQKWLEWLGKAGRQARLDAANEAADAQGLADMFNEFKESRRPVPVPTGKHVGSHSEAPVPPSASKGPPLTDAYIKKMYVDYGRGAVSEESMNAFRQRLTLERGTKNP